MSLINNKVTYRCRGEPKVSFTRRRFIRVGTISLQNFDFRCDQYKLVLSGPDRRFFILHDLKLYIRSNVMNFNMPEKTYNVTISLIDSKTSNLLITRNHSVCVFPCECIES